MFKKWILGLVVVAGLMVGLAGCEPLTAFGTGAATGITLDSLADQAAEDLQENIELVRQKNTELAQLLEQTDDELTQAKIKKTIAGNQKVIGKLQTAGAGVELGRQGMKTNWQDPAAVAGFVALLASAFGNYMQNKKNKLNGSAIREVVKGGQEFINKRPDGVAFDFKAAQAKVQSRDIKTIVAEIKSTL